MRFSGVLWRRPFQSRWLRQHWTCLHLTVSSRTCTVDAATPKPFSQMPGLKGIPLLGNVLQYKRITAGKSTTSFSRLHSELGPIFRMKMLGNRWFVFTSSPEAAEELFRAEGKYPSRGQSEENVEWLHRKLKYSSPMFFAAGEVWQRKRSNAAKQIVPRRVANFVEPLCVIAEDFLSHLETLQDEAGNLQDITPEIRKWAFHGVSYFVYGEKFDTLMTKQKEFIEAAVDFIDCFPGVIVSSNLSTSSNFLTRLFPPLPYRKYMSSLKKVQQLGNQILNRRYEQIRDDMAHGHVNETKAIGLLDQWLIEGKFTPEEAISASCEMLATGVDVTGSITALLVYEIAKAPEIQERLVEEISTVVGEKEHPSWDDLQKMTLVRNCAKEAMRIYSAGGILARTVPDDTQLLGYEVPGRTTVFFTANSASKDDKLFDHPREFQPDRWNKDAEKKIHPFSSLPFGFGPRSCYGRRLAELELYVLVAKMIPKYRLTTSVERMKLDLKAFVKPGVLLHIQLHQRET